MQLYLNKNIFLEGTPKQSSERQKNPQASYTCINKLVGGKSNIWKYQKRGINLLPTQQCNKSFKVKRTKTSLPFPCLKTDNCITNL